MTVYLAGPISGRDDADCKAWRAYAAAELRRGTRDPMVRDYRGREFEPGIAAEIVEQDKRDIDACGVVLVNYDKPSVGTSMEVIYAWERGKYVVVACAPGTKRSPWLEYHCHKVLPSVPAAVAWINENCS